jgi:hypothetical protein
MTMEHKAFVLDDAAFERGLRPLLEQSLRSGDLEPLRKFIETHREELRDPCEGAPLEYDWESMIERRDPEQYGDFALTLYYDPSADLGLGAQWQPIERALEARGISAQLLLGSAVPGFDPGKQGSYFQSAGQVSSAMRRLEQSGNADDVAPALTMFRTAASAGRGLYITF